MNYCPKCCGRLEEAEPDDIPEDAPPGVVFLRCKACNTIFNAEDLEGGV